MISGTALNALRRVVDPEHLLSTPDELMEYGTDGTRLTFIPDAAIFPASQEQISQILKLACKFGFAVVPRGAGSGMSGGSLPVNGGLVVGLNRLNRILKVDQDNLIAMVEPGVITADLQKTVEKKGLFYPPDPASKNISTIGGNVAECAGGLRAVKYGVTRDYVMGLTVVLPTGEIIKTGVATMKGVAGYDLTRLITGSEGTLAIITSITLRLIPKPASKKTMLVLFPDVTSAAKTVSTVINNKITPSILEFMDRICLECVQEEMEIEILPNAKAMLLIEVDGDPCILEQEAILIKKICQKYDCLSFEVASDNKEAEKLWEARRKTSPSLYKLRPHKISEDIVIPRSQMPELLSFLSELGNTYNLPIPSFGHAGDGNIHINIMHDNNRSQDVTSVKSIIRAIFKKVIEMNGTITGEHGIGITKAPYLDMEFDQAGIKLMKRIKKAFDPQGILNPGKIFI